MIFIRMNPLVGDMDKYQRCRIINTKTRSRSKNYKLVVNTLGGENFGGCLVSVSGISQGAGMPLPLAAVTYLVSHTWRRGMGRHLAVCGFQVQAGTDRKCHLTAEVLS